MKRIRLVLAVAVAMAMIVAASSVALAAHQHNLSTPGTCVEDIARGQTDKTAEEPGGHQFHSNVHKGTPGESAFDQQDKVAVGTVSQVPCT